MDFPKSASLIEKLIKIASDSNDTILDFFSGSATTAHAVLNTNVRDGKSRRHIQIQLPEPSNIQSNAYAEGYVTIAEIGKERIRRAGKKILADLNAEIAQKEAEIEKHQQKGATDLIIAPLRAEIKDLEAHRDGLDTGFRVFKIADSNMRDVQSTPQATQQAQLSLLVDNVKDGRKGEDLLFQVMLAWGLPLSLPIERVSVAGKELYKVAGNALYACFDERVDTELIRAIAPDKPLRVVLRDGSFAGSDNDKGNAEQLLAQLSPNTVLRVL